MDAWEIHSVRGLLLVMINGGRYPWSLIEGGIHIGILVTSLKLGRGSSLTAINP